MNKTNNYLHRVFVYGTLMKDCGNSGFLYGSTLVGTAKTKGKYLLTASGIPYVIKSPPDKFNDDIVNVKGEVYLVSDDILIRSLDMLEGHPVCYCREEVEIVYDDPSIADANEEVKAWLYFYPRVTGDVVKDGDYRKLREDEMQWHSHYKEKGIHL